METMNDKIKTLHDIQEHARKGGGKEKQERHRKFNKLTARERVEYLLDDSSFREINMLAETQCFAFNMQKKKIAGDGVITGYGKIRGREIFIFAQDSTVLGGSCGRTHAQKIIQVIRLARKVGTPVVGLYDSAGARLQEGVENISGYGAIFFENAITSGVVPQIAAVMGPCVGGGSFSPALMDFIIQVERTGQMFSSSPAVIREATGEEITPEQLGGSGVHSQVSGLTTLVAQNDQTCLDMIANLIHFLPQSNLKKPPILKIKDDVERSCDKLTQVVPADLNEPYDIKTVIREVVDENHFYELCPFFAKNIVIGFGRLAGRTVGIIANQPIVHSGYINIDASDKASRFIRFCDAFNIPLISFVDVPGYMPGIQQEHSGIIRHGAKLLYAWSESTVPKITCILRKAYGGAIPGMCCHEVGADQVLIWPTAEMDMVSAEAAANILFKKEIESGAMPEKVREELVTDYRNKYTTAFYAASKQLIDMVIDPRDTRRLIIDALLMLEGKKVEGFPARKHGVMPS